MENVFPFLLHPSLSPNIQNWRNLVFSEHAYGLGVGLFSWELEIPVPGRGVSNFSVIFNLNLQYSKGFSRH